MLALVCAVSCLISGAAAHAVPLFRHPALGTPAPYRSKYLQVRAAGCMAGSSPSVFQSSPYTCLSLSSVSISLSCVSVYVRARV